MGVIHFDGAPLTQYQEVINGAGEIDITARFQGQEIHQAIIAVPPCVIFFDPNNLSFYAVSINGLIPGWQFVEIVNEIT